MYEFQKVRTKMHSPQLYGNAHAQPCLHFWHASMSYKPLGEEGEGNELEVKVTPGNRGKYVCTDEEVRFDDISAGEETDDDAEGHTLLIDDSKEQGGRRGGVARSADAMFEQDSWKYKYTRRLLAVGALQLLLGLLAAAITMIVVSPSCPSTSSDLLWWQTTIIYQCYPRSFQDSDGDGDGDLNGIRSRLDYFVETGIGAVWLNPIYTSPQKDNGYDISDYTDIDPLYGTLKDFQSLLEEMHKRDIKLIMDFVPNHSSNEHPWFLESRSSLNNSKRDWYIWSDGIDGGLPNNWISRVGGSAWSYDNITGQYYFHQYSDFQPDLNYRNSEVQEAMKDVLRFWLDLGVDGFRMDAVVFLLEDAKLENETRNTAYSGNNCTTNISRKNCYHSLVHNLTANYDGIHEVIRSWRQLLDSYSKPGKERFMVGEVLNPMCKLVTYYGNNSDEFDFPFNFLLLKKFNWTGTEISNRVAEWLDNIPEGAWSNWVLGNHDNPRISSRAGVYMARALNVLLLTLPGTPTTYYGEEIMMTDVFVPPPERHDVIRGRDKERTPMQWNTSDNAGFTYPASKPWLPVATNYTTYNVEVENSDHLSSLSLYKTLSELRSNYSALQYTGYQHIYNSTDVFAYLRFDNSSELLIVINFSVEPAVIDISDEASLVNTTVILSSNLNRTGDVDLENVQLLGGEAVIIEGSMQ